MDSFQMKSLNVDDMIDEPIDELIHRCAWRKRIAEDMEDLGVPEPYFSNAKQRYRDTNAALRAKIGGVTGDALKEIKLLLLAKRAEHHRRQQGGSDER